MIDSNIRTIRIVKYDRPYEYSEGEIENYGVTGWSAPDPETGKTECVWSGQGFETKSAALNYADGLTRGVQLCGRECYLDDRGEDS